MKDVNKKQRNMFLIGLVSLFLIIAGAAYAFFEADTVINFGTSTINAITNEMGSVALNGTNLSLNMSISAQDMIRGNSNVTYYATTSGKTTTETEEVVAVASVIPNTDTNYYHCEYTLNISHTGTKDMYTEFNKKTNGTTYDYTNRGTGQVILLINGEEYDWASTNGMPSTIDGEFYIKGAQTVNLTAGLKFVNISNVDQAYLAGSDMNITISVANNSFRCTVANPASQTLIALTEDSNNASKISQYTGAVTDSCDADSCTTINSAQNVYVFTSDDINNVIFEDFCWKIIRTTETGGVKLLYNGLPTTNGNHQECTATGVNTMLTAAQMNTSSNTITYSQGGAKNKPAYVGYMYNPNTISGTYKQQLRGDTTYDVNTNDSWLKEKTEYWFSHSNIDETKLEDAVYCNDRSLVSSSPVTEAQLESTSSGEIRFKNYNRSFNTYECSLECSLITDSFNTANTKAQTNYKVGFMTEPERYLMTSTPANNGQVYWLGSPSFFLEGYAYIFGVRDSGESTYTYAGYTFGVRPVISSAPSVEITGGTGSTTNPFIFE